MRKTHSLIILLLFIIIIIIGFSIHSKWVCCYSHVLYSTGKKASIRLKEVKSLNKIDVIGIDKAGWRKCCISSKRKTWNSH